MPYQQLPLPRYSSISHTTGIARSLETLEEGIVRDDTDETALAESKQDDYQKGRTLKFKHLTVWISISGLVYAVFKAKYWNLSTPIHVLVNGLVAVGFLAVLFVFLWLMDGFCLGDNKVPKLVRATKKHFYRRAELALTGAAYGITFITTLMGVVSAVKDAGSLEQEVWVVATLILLAACIMSHSWFSAKVHGEGY